MVYSIGQCDVGNLAWCHSWLQQTFTIVTLKASGPHRPKLALGDLLLLSWQKTGHCPDQYVSSGATTDGYRFNSWRQ